MKYVLNCLVIFSLSFTALASPLISYEGTTKQLIARTPSSQSTLNAMPPKTVTLLKIKIAKDVKKIIQKNALAAKQRFTSGLKNLPSSVQLGMNNVPVLDQGWHGSCATFALFAALDALHGHDDYYSELCSLNVGKTIAENGYSGSGWNGQSIKTLLARADEYGLVSKQDQRAIGCGGVTEYPLQEEDTSEAMPLEAFHAISEPVYYSGLNEWSMIFDVTQWLSKNKSMDTILERTKTSLYYGNRVIVGTLLPIIDGNIGFLGSKQAPNDTLVLTPRIEQAIQLFLMEYSNWGGHAMVITGYDDDAIAIDNEGRHHKGLFTLRNSWGSDVGDHGNFYMSYDYFKSLVIELEELIKVAP
jgi:hypothetical protein